MQKFVYDDLGHAKFQLFNLIVTDLIRLAQKESDKVLKFVKLLNW